MFLMIVWILLLAFVITGILVSKTTREWPKSWYEWKTEFRYQYIGMVGLYHDWTHADKDRVALYSQPGRVAVITGGNRGIGLKVIQKLLACDMTVIMGVRDPASAEATVRSEVDIDQSNGKLYCEKLNVSDLKSVKAFADKIKSKYEKVDLLINNAGVMFVPFRLTADGFESHLATNYLGHFLLTHLLMPQLRAAGQPDRNSRIVNVSSCVNLIGRINYNDINGLKNYYPATAYSQSKLAQIMATRHLQRLLDTEKAHVQVAAVHPGIVDTDLFEHSATTKVPIMKKMLFKQPEQGARTIVYAAIGPREEGNGGSYLSNCVKAPMHPDAKKPDKCEKLFQYTCELLKIKTFGNGEL